MASTALDFVKMDSQLRRFPGVAGVPDQERWSKATYHCWETHGFIQGDCQPVAAFDPPITLNLPAPSGFDLDYFKFNSLTFCSARLRAALAQPASVVQYVPVTVNSPDSLVMAMDYQIMRVLAGQKAIDLDLSECEVHAIEDRFVGGTVRSVGWADHLVMLENLVPQTELFHAAEQSLNIYATDRLAERVMQAGVLGVEFRDTGWSYSPGHPHPIRTWRGVEDLSPATRRAHMRLVKRMRKLNTDPSSPGSTHASGAPG